MPPGPSLYRTTASTLFLTARSRASRPLWMSHSNQEIGSNSLNLGPRCRYRRVVFALMFLTSFLRVILLTLIFLLNC